VSVRRNAVATAAIWRRPVVLSACAVRVWGRCVSLGLCKLSQLFVVPWSVCVWPSPRRRRWVWSGCVWSGRSSPLHGPRPTYRVGGENTRRHFVFSVKPTTHDLDTDGGHCWPCVTGFTWVLAAGAYNAVASKTHGFSRPLCSGPGAPSAVCVCVSVRR